MLCYKVFRKLKHTFNHNKLHGGIVSITFDDQWYSAYINALPLLDSYNFKSTWYVCYSNIGKRDNESGERYMSREELFDLKNKGHEIASHTISHCDFNSVAIETIKNELVESKAKLMSEFDCSVSNFAYPYTFTGEHVGAPQTAMTQYRSARGGDLGLNSYPFRRENLFACKLYNSRYSLDYLKALVDICATENKWLIFYTHDVKENCTEYGCTPELFHDLLTYLFKIKIKVDTVENIIA